MAEVTSESRTDRACAVVRRYVTEALFGADEYALRQTVADDSLQERAWLFWAAFSERHLDDIDLIFASADGDRVACHFSGNLIQVGPWVTNTTPMAGGFVVAECTGIYVLAEGRIVNYRETWR